MSSELISRVGIAGNHLGLVLDVDHPPHTASFKEGLEHYGAGEKYEIWTAWKICYEVFIEGKSQQARDRLEPGMRYAIEVLERIGKQLGDPTGKKWVSCMAGELKMEIERL